MVQGGESIENPVTGERLVFRTTTADGGGELLVIDLFVRADGPRAGTACFRGRSARALDRPGWAVVSSSADVDGF